MRVISTKLLSNNSIVSDRCSHPGDTYFTRARRFETTCSGVGIVKEVIRESPTRHYHRIRGLKCGSITFLDFPSSDKMDGAIFPILVRIAGDDGVPLPA